MALESAFNFWLLDYLEKRVFERLIEEQISKNRNMDFLQLAQYVYEEVNSLKEVNLDFLSRMKIFSTWILTVITFILNDEIVYCYSQQQLNSIKDLEFLVLTLTLVA